MVRYVYAVTCGRTHRRWWGDMSLGRNILNNSGIVAKNMITMPRWRRVVIGHVVIAHVNVLQVLWLSLSGSVFDRWGHVLPSLV
jgi:hypothetical protein